MEYIDTVRARMVSKRSQGGSVATSDDRCLPSKYTRPTKYFWCGVHTLRNIRWQSSFSKTLLYYITLIHTLSIYSKFSKQ